jgi:biotin operon repressor
MSTPREAPPNSVTHPKGNTADPAVLRMPPPPDQPLWIAPLRPSQTFEADPLSTGFAIGASPEQVRRAVAHAASEAVSRQRVYRTVQTQAIRALLEVYPTHSVRHIAAELGMSKNSVTRELQTLADDPATIEPRTNTCGVRDAWAAAGTA